MDFSPIINAPFSVQVHVVFAITSLVLVPFILFGRKGDRRHKMLGRIWVAAMALTAISSFAIMDIRLIGPFSPIHGLSILTLYSLFGAVREARAGRVEAHKRHILGAMGGLLGAGVFTVLPGRLMSDVLFGQAQLLGFVFVLVLGAAGFVLWRAKLRHAI